MADANVPSSDLSVGPEPPPRLRTMRDDLVRVKQGDIPTPSALPLAEEIPTPKPLSLSQPAPPLPLSPVYTPPSVEAPPDLLLEENTSFSSSPPPLPPTFSVPENLPVAPHNEPEPFLSPSLPPPQLVVMPPILPVVSPISQPSPTSELPTPSAPLSPHEDFDLLGHLEQQPHVPEPEPAPSFQEEPEISHLETPEDRLTFGDVALPTLPDDAPLRPEELLALEEDVAAPFEEHRRKFAFKLHLGKKPLLIGGSVVIAAILIGVGYAALTKKSGGGDETPLPNAPLITENPEPPIPEVLIPLTSTGTITIREINEASAELHSLFAKPTDVGALRGVFLKLDPGKEKRYLTFEEMLAAIGFSMTDETRASLNTSVYTLFTYGESDGETRAGFVVRVKDLEAAKSTLAAREKDLPQDSDQLLRSLGQVTQPTSLEFSSNIHRDLTIRYLNLADPNLTLDYVLDSNRQLLIVSTSRASMFAAIDVLP